MLLGIDLGTTFSAVAYVNSEGKAEIITNRDGERVTPSVVMFEDGGIVVGEQAKDNSFIDPFNVCQFVKRQMGNKTFSFETEDGKRYCAEDISAMILKRLKDDAENTLNEKIDGVVITVPAYFDDAQRTATKDAGQIAGLNVLGIINEPTAAAIAYCHGIANSDGNVMIFDLGGGTFDITVLQLKDNLKSIDILSTVGIRNMGGFDFDNVIISKVMNEYNEKFNADLMDDDVAYQELRLKAEKAKKQLSVRDKADISIVSNGNALKVTITRAEFEEMISNFIVTIQSYMEEAMEEAKLKWNDLSKILLVGGSTRIPAIQSMIKQLTNIEPSHELNPDEAVALGAAYYASSIDGGQNSKYVEKNDIKVNDVNSHTLGVIALNDDGLEEMTPIIKRNTTLPVYAEREFCLVSDGQGELETIVLQGEDSDPEYDTVIGSARITFKPKEKGYPVIVAMSYDVNGMIHVSLKDGVTKENMGEFNIDREANLTDEEVNSKKDGFNNLKID